ncbi:Ig-like domain-containing domain [Sphingobacterium sp. HJSM2_6]|uniref:Ig-like domain-containing domain n=1 Tax=Sphingobacterium sp. HJSM2_6 TaxID=3366264 RepID=UPI003BF491E8
MIRTSKKLSNSLNRLKSILKEKWAIFPIILVICLSFTQCANMQKPTGGPKDSLPPKLLGETPLNLGTNFKEKTIVLTFDEFIKTTNQQKEFTISPDVSLPLTYKIKKKSLHILLPDSLENNTTYTINLGKGLVDYNEGNPLLNYTYVFATGPELDSLSISGKVSNGYTQTFDLAKDKDVIAILIPTSKDSTFGKKKASYYSAIDSTGNFKFNNLREDTYRIYALKDINNDKIYNGGDEWIGFLNDSIFLNQNISNINLSYTKGTNAKYRNLEKKIDQDGSLLLVFNRPIEDPSIKIIDPVDYDSKKLLRFNTNKDTARLYFEKLDFDSLKLELTELNQILDTIIYKKARNLKTDQTIVPKLNISNKVDRVKHIEISSSYPISSIDKNKVILKEDSVSKRNFQLQQDSVNKELYHVRYNWKAKTNYELVLEEKAILGPYNESNKEFKTLFTLNDAANYGDINLTFTGLNDSSHYLIELIDEKKETIYDKRIIPASRKIAYLQYPGAKYSLRIIEDRNNNGKWDSGDVYKRVQAERLWYLDRTFTIRANWEQNETIDVSFK